MALEAPGAPTPVGFMTVRRLSSGLNEACGVACGLSTTSLCGVESQGPLVPLVRHSCRSWPRPPPPHRCKHSCWEPLSCTGASTAVESLTLHRCRHSF